MEVETNHLLWWLQSKRQSHSKKFWEQGRVGGINNKEDVPGGPRKKKYKDVFLREADERRANQGCYQLYMSRRYVYFP